VARTAAIRASQWYGLPARGVQVIEYVQRHANSTSGFVRVTIDDSLIRGGGNGNGAAAFGGGVASAAPVIVTIMRTKVIGDANGNGISSFGTQTVVTLAMSCFGLGDRRYPDPEWRERSGND
jgi:hypothetical protein